MDSYSIYGTKERAKPAPEAYKISAAGGTAFLFRLPTPDFRLRSNDAQSAFDLRLQTFDPAANDAPLVFSMYDASHPAPPLCALRSVLCAPLQ